MFFGRKSTKAAAETSKAKAKAPKNNKFKATSKNNSNGDSTSNSTTEPATEYQRPSVTNPPQPLPSAAGYDQFDSTSLMAHKPRQTPPPPPPVSSFQPPHAIEKPSPLPPLPPRSPQFGAGSPPQQTSRTNPSARPQSQQYPSSSDSSTSDSDKDFHIPSFVSGKKNPIKSKASGVVPLPKKRSPILSSSSESTTSSAEVRGIPQIKILPPASAAKKVPQAASRGGGIKIGMGTESRDIPVVLPRRASIEGSVVEIPSKEAFDIMGVLLPKGESRTKGRRTSAQSAQSVEKTKRPVEIDKVTASALKDLTGMSKQLLDLTRDGSKRVEEEGRERDEMNRRTIEKLEEAKREQEERLQRKADDIWDAAEKREAQLRDTIDALTAKHDLLREEMAEVAAERRRLHEELAQENLRQQEAEKKARQLERDVQSLEETVKQRITVDDAKSLAFRALRKGRGIQMFAATGLGIGRFLHRRIQDCFTRLADNADLIAGGFGADTSTLQAVEDRTKERSNEMMINFRKEQLFLLAENERLQKQVFDLKNRPQGTPITSAQIIPADVSSLKLTDLRAMSSMDWTVRHVLRRLLWAAWVKLREQMVAVREYNRQRIQKVSPKTAVQGGTASGQTKTSDRILWCDRRFAHKPNYYDRLISTRNGALRSSFPEVKVEPMSRPPFQDIRRVLQPTDYSVGVPVGGIRGSFTTPIQDNHLLDANGVPLPTYPQSRYELWRLSEAGKDLAGLLQQTLPPRTAVA